jgi:phosphosulfolactate synthase (CoM biosynthesis protein A)
MAHDIKTQLKTNIETVKAQGSTRAARIRDILKSAASETIAEVKQGTGDMRAIATDTFSTVVNTLDESEINSTTQPVSAESVRTDASSSKSLLTKLFLALKTRLVTQVKHQAVKLDDGLGARYGDRYQTSKERLHQVAGQVAQRYQQEIATAKAQGSTPLQHTQARMHERAGAFGAVAARTEQQIKARLKSLVQTTVTKL